METPHPANAERPEPVVPIYHEIRGYLENRRDQLCQEITSHPTPIPACDVHFNRLLEERAKVFQELGQLDELRQNLQAHKHDIALIEDFIRSSEAIRDEDRYKLSASLKNALAESDV